MTFRGIFGGVLLCAISLFYAESSAAQARPVLDKAARLYPVPQSRARGKHLTVLAESLHLDCHKYGLRLVCSSESVLRVDNDGAAQNDVTFEVDYYAEHFTVNGVEVMLSPRQGIGNGDLAITVGSSSRGATPRTANVNLPHGQSTLVLVLPQAVNVDASPAAAKFFAPALITRHPLFGHTPGSAAGVDLTLQSAAVSKRYRDVLSTQVTLESPDEWSSYPSFAPCEHREPDTNGCIQSTENGRRQVVWQVTSTEPIAAPLSRSVTLIPPSGVITSGGPFVGASFGGGAGCLGCVEAVRMRTGYEIGLDDWGLLQFVGEFSRMRRVAFVPTLDYEVVPQLRFIPSLALGAGVPLVISPSFQAGARGQLSATWSLGRACSLGVLTMLDILVDKEGSHISGGLATQLGL